MSNDVVDRARKLVGTRFRAQGRDAGLGVDCLGLAIFVYHIEATAIRRDYRLGGDHKKELMAGLGQTFRRVPSSRARAGDLLLMRIAERQYHLAVRTATGFIHADARLGVVETPGMPAWPVIAAYRQRVRARRSEG